MYVKHITFIGLILICLCLVNNCAPPALHMIRGPELDNKIKNNKLTVAVFPAVDWSTEEGCCRGYFLYGCGTMSRRNAYENVGWLVTNEITKVLWKKNKLNLVNKQNFIRTIQRYKLKPSDILPPPDMACCGLYSKPIYGAQKTGKGVPDYRKIIGIGDEIGVDIIFLIRISKNTQTNYCLKTASPLSLIPYVYKGLIKKYKNMFIVIDIMALDVKNRQLLAWGGYNKAEEIPNAEKSIAMEKYTKAITFYSPMPDNKDLEKVFIANAASQVTTLMTNMIIESIGIPIQVTFDFSYEFEDETWKMYPEDYFEKNYGFTKNEYYSIFN
jgi:hypothetical protein